MATIKFGKQKDESKSVTTINTSGASNTEIVFNDIYDKSERIVHINDEAETSNLLLELAKLSIALEEINEKSSSDAIKKAKESLEKKDQKDFLFWLKKAGEKSINLAIDKGLPFLAGILMSVLK